MTGVWFERLAELADGRVVEVRRGGPLEPWDVQLVGLAPVEPKEPWLLAALVEALVPVDERPPRAPDYVF